MTIFSLLAIMLYVTLITYIVACIYNNFAVKLKSPFSRK